MNNSTLAYSDSVVRQILNFDNKRMKEGQWPLSLVFDRLENREWELPVCNGAVHE